MAGFSAFLLSFVMKSLLGTIVNSKQGSLDLTGSSLKCLLSVAGVGWIVGSGRSVRSEGIGSGKYPYPSAAVF